MNAVDKVKPFMEPKSVALVGVSSRTGMYAFNILENLMNSGYRGEIYPVKPNTDSICGKKTYATLKDITAQIDLVVISTPRSQVPAIVEDCVKKGIKAGIIIGQGFSDANDEEGKELQEEITRLIQNTKTRIIGPNTIGVSNPFINFSTSFLTQTALKRLPIGVICQTGIFFGSFPELILLGKGIDLGNSCDLDFVDCLEYYEHDKDVEIIFLHIEGINEGRRLMEVAKRIARQKPILALKTGTSPLALKAAESHTGSIIGNNDIWEVGLKQSGIIKVDDLGEISDLFKGLSCLPPINGRSIGIVSVSGGMGVMAIDACEEFELNVPELSPETREILMSLSPEWHTINNPVDIWPAIGVSRHPFGEVLKTTIQAVLSDNRIDAVLLFIGAWFEMLSPPFSDIVLEAAEEFNDKPVVWTPYDGWLHDISTKDIEEKLSADGRVPIFSSPRRALRVLSRMADYSEFLKS